MDVDPYAATTPGASPPGPGESGPVLAAGRTLGDYTILRELGRGGMGVVYLARDAALDREVALKVLQPRLASDPEFEKRFIREARTAAKLDHPNIVQVYSAGRAGDVLYIAMQVVKGETLDAVLKARGPLPAREAVDIVRQAALALQAAHDASLVHRDIKPNNIMIDAAGRVKIMDFGLMRSHREAEAITEPGVFFGTPEYASPEQCETSEIDGRADLYSLGAVFYEMLTGRRPHAGDTPLALFRKIIEEPPVPVRKLRPDVPPAVDRLVEAMMAKRPEARVASAAEVVAAASAILDGTAPERATRRPLLLGTAALLIAGLAGSFLLRAPSAAPVEVDLQPGQKLKLVVFDLKNGIPKADTAWYSIALSDMLIASLSGQARLDLPTRDVLLWKLKEMELAGKVGEDNRRVLTGELGARAYLSGTYYVQNGKIRLTLAGYRLPDSTQLFPALSFDGAEGNLFGLVDQASAAVSRALLGGEAPSIALLQQGEAQDRLRERAARPAAPPAPRAAAPAAGGGDAAQAQKEQRRLSGGTAGQADKDEKKASSPGAVDLTRAWYENRKALESGRLKKEDFEALAGLLQREFRKQNGPREGSTDDLKKLEKPAASPRLEFACPSCNAVASSFGRCDPCDRYLLVRLKPDKSIR